MNSKVTPRDIRDFRGSKTEMSVKKIFITTSEYTKGAVEEAADLNQPIILINGEQLINFCKRYNDKLFDVRYYFNDQQLDDLFQYDNYNIPSNFATIERRVTKNDVRARILRIPNEYKCLMKNKKTFSLFINGTSYREYNISSDKSHFGGVTKFYKDFISNVYFECAQFFWTLNEDKQSVNVIIK